MIRDAEVPAEQEMNYLRSYTKGEVQKAVETFRKRRYGDPATVLEDTWKDLERRSGNVAAITNTLLERLSASARFEEKDKAKLQVFGDLYADVDSQLAHLPGLACLNYPNALRPIVGRLPTNLRSKWEKEVAKYADRHQDAFPGFRIFASMVIGIARMRNHPNVLARGVLKEGEKTREALQKRRSPSPRGSSRDRRALKSNLQTDSTNREIHSKYCPFHDRRGHDLAQCEAFGGKSLEEKTRWLWENYGYVSAVYFGIRLLSIAKRTPVAKDVAAAVIKPCSI